MTANKQKPPSVGSIAKIVAIATIVSKLFGLIRAQVIATAFGIGMVSNAYTYAYNIPGFIFVLIGGINGPFHSALISVLAKRDRSQAAPIVETVSTIVSLSMIVVTAAIVIFPDFWLNIVGADLNPRVKEIAILQLQIMAPLALFGGLIGIGFGTLNSVDNYLLPSISPLFSSVAIVVGVSSIFWQLGKELNTPDNLQLGAIILAGSTLAGAILQWLAQLIVQLRAGLGGLKLRFDLNTPGVTEVFKVMIPAVISSGMIFINLQVDLRFVSGIEGAGIAITNATLIYTTPLGIVSNMILVPFLPVFSRLAAPEHWSELKVKIRQGLFLSALTMLPLTAIFMSLALPIIKLAFERGEFNNEASQLVASLLVVYGFGIFFYLSRDVLVRVFFGLGDGDTPFKISVINILLNAFLDYMLIKVFNLGAPGLLMATVGVNISSMIIFIWILNRRLNGLPLLKWGQGIAGLFVATAVSGFACYGISQSWERAIGNGNLFLLLLELSISSAVAILIFGAIAAQLKLPELNMLTSRIRQKIGR